MNPIYFLMCSVVLCASSTSKQHRDEREHRRVHHPAQSRTGASLLQARSFSNFAPWPTTTSPDAMPMVAPALTQAPPQDCIRPGMDVGGAGNACGFMPTVLIVSPKNYTPSWYKGETEIAELATVEECQAKCVTVPNCDYFRYDDGHHVCFLKKDYTADQKKNVGGSCEPLYEPHLAGAAGPKECLGCCSWGSQCGDCGDNSGWCHKSSANCAQCADGAWDGNSTRPICHLTTPVPTPSSEQCEEFTDGVCDDADCFEWRGSTECKISEKSEGKKRCRCKNYPDECAVRSGVFPFLFAKKCVPFNESQPTNSTGGTLQAFAADLKRALSLHINNSAQSFR